MMVEKISEMSTQGIKYEVDLNAIKRKSKQSEYTAFVQVRLTEKMKKELVEFCRREEVYVGTLLREMVEGYLKQIRE